MGPEACLVRWPALVMITTDLVQYFIAWTVSCATHPNCRRTPLPTGNKCAFVMRTCYDSTLTPKLIFSIRQQRYNPVSKP